MPCLSRPCYTVPCSTRWTDWCRVDSEGKAMTMRDLQRLEELSSAAALGLWADDIVLALDRAATDAELVDADTRLLTDAAEMLEAALERTEHPLATPKSARG